MEFEELKNVWQKQDAKLNESISLNKSLLKEIKLEKAQSRLQKLYTDRIWRIVFYAGIMLLFGLYIGNNAPVPQLMISGVVYLILAAIGLIGAINQLTMVQSIDFSDSIPVILKKLTLLKLNVLRFIRLGIWTVPLYTASIIIMFDVLWGVDIYTVGDKNWWVSQIVLSALFVPLAFWLYNKLSIKNMNKGYMKNLFNSSGGRKITESIDFLNEIATFEKNAD
jgi:hypothetical protein